MKTTQIESVKYLSCCRILESEAYFLYAKLTTKLDRPEISSITLAIAYDGLKHSKVIQELFKPITDINKNLSQYLNQCNKDFREVWKEINKFSGDLSKIDTINDEALPDLLKGLANLEDCLYEIYTFFLDSRMLKQFADVLSGFSLVTPENLAFIIECLREDNHKHREMLIESSCFFNKSQLKNKEYPAPIVKYQNPDGWIIT